MVEEELKGEGVELDLVAAMEELGLQENSMERSDSTLPKPDKSPTEPQASCKVGFVFSLLNTIEYYKHQRRHVS